MESRHREKQCPVPIRLMQTRSISIERFFKTDKPMNPISPSEIKSIELSILEHIDKTCRENGIRYFLSYGTLLGAVRHKGFIPWDDDIDICILRPDYEKFMKLASESDTRFRLLHLSTDKKYYYEFAKVVDSKTQVFNEGLLPNENEGVWVDIFPIDKVSYLRRTQRFLVKVALACRILSVYRKFPAKHSRLWHPIWLASKLIGPRFFLHVTDFLSKHGKDSGTVGYIASNGDAKYCFGSEIFAESVSLPFEDKTFPAPKEYDRYLTCLYGDYMQLPPEDKRVTHSISAFWRD